MAWLKKLFGRQADRFSVSPEGVIKDNKSGLEWVVGPDIRATYDGAEEWVKDCHIAGGGWRMPTRAELHDICFQDGDHGNVPPVFKTTGRLVWAEPKEDTESSKGCAWHFNFHTWGTGYYSRRTIDESSRVFGVRSMRPAQPAPTRFDDTASLVSDLASFVAQQWASERDPSLRLSQEDYRRILTAMAALPVQPLTSLPPDMSKKDGVSATKAVPHMASFFAQAMCQGHKLKIDMTTPAMLRVQTGMSFCIMRTGTNEFRLRTDG